MHDRLTTTAFEALAYELADAAQRMRVHHIAARALADHPAIGKEYGEAAAQARGALFAALSACESAAESMLTAMAFAPGPDDGDCSLGKDDAPVDAIRDELAVEDRIHPPGGRRRG